MYMKSNPCEKGMSFNDCELAILRSAVDQAEDIQSRKDTNTPEVKKMMDIVEQFLVKKGLICYGGTAINNILPKQDQFYDLNVEIPDYDFFSPDPLKDARELADIYVKEGFSEVEAKSGVHYGTFKVFVNFIPVADITLLDPVLFKAIKKDSISIAGIRYCPPNFLRMLGYLELSRPAGDVSRWEKVQKRINLLNKHYPLKIERCNYENFNRKFEDDDAERIKTIYEVSKDSFVNQGVVFFGGYAVSLYSKYMPRKIRSKFSADPDFDVLSEHPHKTCVILKERLEDAGITGVKITKKKALGEVIAEHYEVRVGKDAIAFVYYPLSCHSYNVVHEGGRSVRVATIDTMISFYLSFIYAGRPYYDDARILCMANFLFQVQQSNRLKQKGLLRRFSIACYGTQKTLGDIRGDRASKFLELKNKRGTKEYDAWFLKYRPGDGKIDGTSTASKTASKTASNTMKKKAPTKKRKSTKTRSSTRKNFLARFLR
jgi:hypothetical protein